MLLTVNFQWDPLNNLIMLKSVQVGVASENSMDHVILLQPDKPLMVMEYWSGWFSHWNEPQPQLSLSPEQAVAGIQSILSMKSSFNLYMFHGEYYIADLS